MSFYSADVNKSIRTIGAIQLPEIAASTPQNKYQVGQQNKEAHHVQGNFNSFPLYQYFQLGHYKLLVNSRLMVKLSSMSGAKRFYCAAWVSIGEAIK
jgi:hypothetical protein